MVSEIYPIGQSPPLGEIPRQMYAHVIREERFGEPIRAFEMERVDVPAIRSDECLVLMMAAGVNYNGVWAASGRPMNVVRAHEKENDGNAFHIGGSEGAGIVYKIGDQVTNVRVGDDVVIHAGCWDPSDPRIKAGIEPLLTPAFKIWGYETNYGGFAQFARVKWHQLFPKPVHLSWDEAAVYLGNAGAAYRALRGFPEHRIEHGHVALIWGGAGGVGSLAIQICNVVGAVPIAVISDDNKTEFCIALGAKGVINRTRFNHWGMLPHWDDTTAYAKWLEGAKAFGKTIWDVLGMKRNPRIVFEHPGEETIPTSCFVCDTGGMVVICGGTSGYNATLDLRHHWMRQKRLQGTHCSNTEQTRAINDLVRQKKIDPCLSRTFSFDEIPLAHQLMYEHRHPNGNMAALVCAPERGIGRRS